MTRSKAELNMQNTGIEELTADESLAISGGGYWETGFGLLCGVAVMAALLL